MDVIESIFGKEPGKVELADIDNLIQQKREEGRNLEYKGPDILGKPERLSQWISAFLNTDGGLIIIGVCEDDPKKKEKVSARILPVRIEFVGSEYPKERVEQLIFSNIRSSSEPDIRVYPVRDVSDSTRVIYLIEVPQGDNPPYQAADDKYYRRLNATKYSMSHSEIADFFGRRRKPRLVVHCELIKVNMDESWFDLRVFVANEGKAIAKYATAVISFQNLEIMKVTQGPSQRIDELRGNVPSLQWSSHNVGVIHPAPPRQRIWEIRLTLREGKAVGVIIWDTIAEDQEHLRMSTSVDLLLLERAKSTMEMGHSLLLENIPAATI